MEIYMGCLDDQVVKYPWLRLNYSLDDYLDELMCQIIIGRNPVINDGYIVQNKIIRDELLERSDSFLFQLIKENVVTIAARHKTFSGLIDAQKRGNVPDFVNLESEIINRLNDFDNALTSKARVIGPESTQIWQGFYSLMNSVRGVSFSELGMNKNLVSETNFQSLLDKFFSKEIEEKTERLPSRGQWEKILEEMRLKNQLLQGNETKIALMNFANEAYHYNFAKQMALTLKRPVAVQTILSPAFSHLIKRKNDFGEMQNRAIPLITIPWPNKIKSPESLENLMGNSSLAEARRNFISALLQYQADPSKANHLEDLIHKANEYNSLIKRELSGSEELKNSMRQAQFGLTLLTATLDPTLMVATGVSLILNWTLSDRGVIAEIMEKKTKRINYLDKTIVASAIDV